MRKTESMSEYIARGGKITKISTQEALTKNENVKSMITGPASIMSMDEADLYYGEQKKRRANKKVNKTINIADLPEALRKKYVDEVINAEENEEDDDAE